MTGRSRHALTSLELEVRRLLAHIDRNAARRFLTNPEPPTGFSDFSDSRRDPIGLAQEQARADTPDERRFYEELREMLAKEQS